MHSKNSRKRSRKEETHNYDDQICSDVISPGIYTLDELALRAVDPRPFDVEGRKTAAAIVFGYLGSNYQGLQLNANVPTIEKELFAALYLSGTINPRNYGYLSKLDWTRGSRTDKGVHSLCQVISLKLVLPTNCLINDDETGDEDGRQIALHSLVACLNRHLPSDIRAFHIFQTTKAFDARIFCSHRTYCYIMPAFMLLKSIVLNSILTRLITSTGSTNDEIDACVDALWDASRSESILNLEQFSRHFVGSHLFHHYTCGKSCHDPSSSRYIISISHSSVSVGETGQVWVSSHIQGQSFLYHQIRKMMCMVAMCAQGEETEESIDVSLSKNSDHFQGRIVPLVSEGLFLEQMHFDEYNRKMAENGSKKGGLDISVCEQDRNLFRSDIIGKIATRETCRAFVTWLNVRKRFKSGEVDYAEVKEEEGDGDG